MKAEVANMLADRALSIIVSLREGRFPSVMSCYTAYLQSQGPKIRQELGAINM